MSKQKQVAYLTYYKNNEKGEEYNKTFATINFEEVYKFKGVAELAGIKYKVNYTLENVSTEADHYTVRPKEAKVKVKRPNLWQKLENWLQS